MEKFFKYYIEGMIGEMKLISDVILLFGPAWLVYRWRSYLFFVLYFFTLPVIYAAMSLDNDKIEERKKQHRDERLKRLRESVLVTDIKSPLVHD